MTITSVVTQILLLERHQKKSNYWENFYKTQLIKDLYLEYECMYAQSCPTLCSPTDGSLPGSSAHGIFQASILKWGAISYSRGSS